MMWFLILKTLLLLPHEFSSAQHEIEMEGSVPVVERENEIPSNHIAEPNNNVGMKWRTEEWHEGNLVVDIE